ncbi:MAG: hypothetical protein L3J83_03735, partial [Proteobacteria bacterium]|nr:hypothetical protein [Pseudomonadota bacterium]
EQQFKARKQLNGQVTSIQKKLIPLVQSGQMSEEEAQKIMMDDARGIDTKKERVAEQFKSQFSNSINDLYKMIEKEGTETWGTDSKRMKTMYTDLLLQGKEAYNLGVLSGPDLKLMENLVNDPTSIASGLNPFAGGNIRSQLETLADKFNLPSPSGVDNKQPDKKLTPEQMQDTLLKY